MATMTTTRSFNSTMVRLKAQKYARKRYSKHGIKRFNSTMVRLKVITTRLTTLL